MLKRPKTEVFPFPPKDLAFDQVSLFFICILPGTPSLGLVPAYHFHIIEPGDADAGHINFRIGDTPHILQCAGHIGYEVAEPFRGHHYAYQACQAIAPFIRTFYDDVTITCNPDNIPSRRTIERLGATFLDEVPVPQNDPHYLSGARIKRRYLWKP